MGLPKSTIVMAVLTCVPFGFAVRDLMSDKDKPGYRGAGADYESDEDEIDSEQLERYAREQEEANEAEQRREGARAAQRKAELAVAVGKLFGAEPASLGTAFGSIKLGISDVELDKHEDTVLSVRSLVENHYVAVMFDANHGVLDHITLESTENGEDLCELVGEKLDARWSEHVRVGGTSVWTGPSQRVEVSGAWDCKIVFRQAVTTDAWISKKGSVVPFAMIGKSTSELLKSLEPQRADLGEESWISWKAPGLGAGTGPTGIDAAIDKGKVVALHASVNIDDATFAELEKQLDATFGPAKERDGEPVWGTKVPVRITLAGAEFKGPISHVITIGKLPAEN